MVYSLVGLLCPDGFGFEWGVVLLRLLVAEFGFGFVAGGFDVCLICVWDVACLIDFALICGC